MKDQYGNWVSCFQPFGTIEEARKEGLRLLATEEIKSDTMEINWMEGHSWVSEHFT